MKKQMHALAVPTTKDSCEKAIDCGMATSVTEAKRIVRAAGYRIMTTGGNIDQYDAQDAPGIYGYAADGFGAISITVHA